MAQDLLFVLIADDDRADRKQIARALNESGIPCKCTETDSIEQALANCEQKAFDLAIVDYRLPGADGLAGITALHDRLPYLPIIMSTGQGDEMVATEAMKRGAMDYIRKSDIGAKTLRRCAENAIEKASLLKKIAQQREELENFARVLAHDFKSPIQSVHAFAVLIDENVRAGKYQDIGEYCGRVIGAAQRTGALIDTLHLYTKAGQRVLFGPVEMVQVMNDTVANLEVLIRDRRVRVSFDALPAVWGNAPQLIQLLQNLIENGIKYCRSSTPCIHVTAQAQSEGGWLFCVRDNGIGIPEKHLRKIFEPFQRLHGSGEFEGTGLGLATCRKIVERHGGSIWCESEEGRGATFFFTLSGADQALPLTSENMAP